MRHSKILHPLAVSLSQSVWTEGAIRECLLLRLPRPLSRLAVPLAERLHQNFPLGTAPGARLIETFLANQPETRRILSFARRHNLRPAQVLSHPSFHPDPALSEAGIPALDTPNDLADWLAITPAQLVRFADVRGLSARSDDPFGPHYIPHLQQKTSGKLRLIEEPRPFLKKLHRRILHDMLNRIPVHGDAFGFCPGRNAIEGAQRHAGEAVVVAFDLADFFPCITMTRIFGLFRAFGYPHAVARDLAGLTTALTPGAILKEPNLSALRHLATRHLPQGAPTSPALANAAAYRLDCRLSGLARRLGANYTRYADDLTFSGDRFIRGPLTAAVPGIIADEGFAMNPAKTRIMPAHRQQVVTGIVVNARTNIKRTEFDRLKARLHRLSQPGDPGRHDTALLARLSGRIAWVEALNPARGAKLRRLLDTVLTERASRH